MSSLEIALVVLSGVMAIAIVLLTRAFLRARRERRRLFQLLASLEKERPALAQMIRNIKDDEPRRLIRKRSELVERLLAAAVSKDFERSNAILDELEDLVSEREEFMRQTRLIYERIQPKMITHLRECGLNDEEVEVCCLYALGLNGKAIQNYTKDGRHYQNVGLIRKKLGLGEHDKNINGFIRSLMQ